MEGWAGRILEAKDMAQPGDWFAINSYLLRFLFGGWGVVRQYVKGFMCITSFNCGKHYYF